MSSPSEKNLIKQVALTLKYGDIHCVHRGQRYCTDKPVAQIPWSDNNKLEEFTCQACIDKDQWIGVKYFDDELNN